MHVSCKLSRKWKRCLLAFFTSFTKQISTLWHVLTSTAEETFWNTICISQKKMYFCCCNWSQGLAIDPNPNHNPSYSRFWFWGTTLKLTSSILDEETVVRILHIAQLLAGVFCFVLLTIWAKPFFKNDFSEANSLSSIGESLSPESCSGSRCNNTTKCDYVMASDGKALVFQEALGCFTIQPITYPSMSAAAELTHTITLHANMAH